MMTGYADLLDGIATYVTLLFESLPEKQFPYHNLAHTKQVVIHTREIAHHYIRQLNSEQMTALRIAAWFHDTGHVNGELKGHEERGVQLMTDYLEPFKLPADITTLASTCILATRYPTNPKSLPESILCDADTYHLGTQDFQLTDELVKKEMVMRLHLNTDNWKTYSLQFLQAHKFYTGYCQQLLNEGKQKNIEWLMAR